jgi:lysine 2,3-aminomutase
LADSDPMGPVAKQFRPHVDELRVEAYEVADPIGDDAHSPVPGIVHRYPDRVLLKPVAQCVVYCRFCFRRERVGPGHGAPLSDDQLTTALAYIRTHPEIWEVILSGGDPLILSPRRLGHIFGALSRIDHVGTVRLHTRVPVVAPDRITPALIETLKSCGKAVWVAIHVNHADELTDAARAAIGRLVDSGVPLVSQTVLLAGINDSVAALDQLLRRLVELRVKPYYLHHLDAAPGTSRFRRSIAAGREIVSSLRGSLSGLAQPTYVLDLPGGAGKVPVGPTYLHRSPDAPAAYDGHDPFGRPFHYRDHGDGG